MPSNRRRSRSSFLARAIQRFMQRLFRVLSRFGGRRRSTQAGFVFPTTLMLVLMVLLTTTALTYRSFTRSQNAIVQREQKVIYNSATPAIDRAKAKIEFMFSQDDRLPTGLPNSDLLADIMLPAASRTTTQVAGEISTGGDAYTLADETRLDINNDGKLDNAWTFNTDINGDGTFGADEIIVYSILVDDSTSTVKLSDPANQTKANALVTRTGPLATTETSPDCEGSNPEGGWQVVKSSLHKNLQVDVFVANNSAANPTYEAMEFQQSRIADRANKWGAWFRYDLELFPGVRFDWNGAMHTDGSIGMSDKLVSHMVSSHNSCLYNKESSEITLGEFSGFQGQAYSGNSKEDTTVNDNVPVHVWNGSDTVKPKLNVNFNSTNDSVTGGKPSLYAMDPLKLFTEDVAEHIQAPGASTWQRDTAWENTDFVQRGRIINAPTAKPFVDDFFRADNRWGPKPRYEDGNATLDVTQRSEKAGDSITGLVALTSDTAGGEGLDGYWERRAMNTGMRVVVGERLELGNNQGWGYDPTAGIVASDPNAAGDPLYPAKALKDTVFGTSGRVGGNHEYQQRRALRDNLAAVQGMVVYHYQVNGGKFPAACLAMTAHPGTTQTILKSRDFSQTFAGGTTMKADFFNGIGTNGWEFSYPAAFNTETGFESAVESSGPLNRALQNLMQFAGDPNGGAPSFPAVQDQFVHPYPYLSMWGDFSALRRILSKSSFDYSTLSPADKSTLHTAACTLSLLAYNVHSLYASVVSGTAVPDPTVTSLPDVTTALVAAMSNIIQYVQDAATDNNIVGTTKTSTYLANTSKFNPAKTRTWNCDDDNNPSTAPVSTTGFNLTCDTGKYFKTYTWNDWKQILDDTTTATNTEITNIENYGKQMGSVFFEEGFYSILRDRELGFRKGQLSEKTIRPTTVTVAGNEVAWDPGTSETESVTFATGVSGKANLQCDPNYFGEPVSQGTGAIDKAKTTAFAMAACAAYFNNGTPRPATDEPKFPALYYLFPMVDHDHDGTGDHQQPDGIEPLVPPQAAEEYITQLKNSYLINNASNYRLVGTDKFTGLNGLAAVPRASSAWVTPYAANAAGLTNPNGSGQAFRITVSGGGADVAFLDKVIGNGREQLPIRLLDMDIEALTSQNPKNVTGATDTWLTANLSNVPPAKGVVYVAREDAVREDEIVRPKNAAATVATCSAKDATNSRVFAVERVTTCLMNASPTSPQDPPLSDALISLKPVDFAPDPGRRPYGVRLRTRSGSPADFSNNHARSVGMTLVTDNAVYVQGDFNLHSTGNSVATILEEFKDPQTLLNNKVAYGRDFYDKRLKTGLDTATFARIGTGKDRWRPVELLCDSLNILSKQFQDGSLRDYFATGTPGSDGGATSSFMGLNRPDFTSPLNYVTDSRDIVSGGRTGAGTPDTTNPVYVDRNGTYYVEASGTVQKYTTSITGVNQWLTFDDGDRRWKNQIDVTENMYVNAVFVSGTVPKRRLQAYGGLHNYPRFIEYWDQINLFIQGSFIQLNFSTAATAPFDQDAWEPGATPNTAEQYQSYEPPNRRWGYDVGLLYVPPGPAAERFVTISAPRSEYYRQVASDDPYILNLRCAEKTGGSKVFGTNIATNCPA